MAFLSNSPNSMLGFLPSIINAQLGVGTMTEKRSIRYRGIEKWSTTEAVDAIYECQLLAAAVIKPTLQNIADAADEASELLSDVGRLVYIGAGTSGRLAVQDGVELMPTFGWPAERLVYGMAGGMKALTVSVEDAEDSSKAGLALIQEFAIGPKDVVVAVAASGKTPYTVRALQEASLCGALTIGIANNPNCPLFEHAKHAILLDTGSEIIAGSTRMKAGTAQKIALNILSTAIMLCLGRIYDGLMVDMVVSNAKLKQRAINMVSEIADCSLAVAEDALEQSNKNIKQAILICLGHQKEECQSLLADVKGDLSKIVKPTSTNSE